MSAAAESTRPALLRTRPTLFRLGALIGLTASLAGCGLNVQAPDLFLLTRTGQGGKLTLLVNDSGTVSCDRGKAKSLPDSLLLEARDLASSLNGDAKKGLRIAPSRDSVYRYKIKLQDGTVSFPDTAAAGGRHPTLARAELFTVQTAQQVCGLAG